MVSGVSQRNYILDSIAHWRHLAHMVKHSGLFLITLGNIAKYE